MLRALIRSRRRRGIVGAVTLAVAVGLALPASAGLLDDDKNRLGALLNHVSGSCRTATQVPAKLLSIPVKLSVCDLRGTLIRAGSLTVRVPLREGRGVTAASLLAKDAPANAVTELSVVNTGREIVVDVVRVGDEPHKEEPAGEEGSGDAPAYNPYAPPDNTHRQSPPARRQDRVDTSCAATAYGYIGTRNDGMTWYFNAASTPDYMNPATAGWALRQGADVISDGTNNCGLRQRTGIQQSYAGTTSADARCDGPDGQNTVAFGYRPKGTLATTCWWYRESGGKKRVFEADLRFQDNPGVFYYIEPDACQKRYQLAGVAAHEFGHAFGLAHISESHYPDLTMSPTAPPCSYAQATLGYGDWLGIDKLY